MKKCIVTVLLCLGAIACGGETITPVQPSPVTSGGVAPTTNTTPTTTDIVTPITGRLVFASDRDGSYYIYTSSGSDVRRLAPGDRPKWSPNGSQIVYQTAPPDTGIYVMNADGSGQRYLTAGLQPDWSPDGNRIVFMSGAISDGGIYIVGANGTGLTKIVGFDVEGGQPTTPVWSPDGRTIAFVRANYDDPWQIYSVGIDGGAPRRSTQTSGSIVTQSEPEWSPNGSQIVFSTFNGIATMNADGSGWRTVASGRLLDPDWVPGGFVFAKYTGAGPTSLGGWEHRIFAVEGAVERQILPDVTTARKYADLHPDWTR